MNKKRGFLGLIVVASLGAGLWLGSFLSERGTAPIPDVGPAAFIYPEARPMPAFALQSHDGQPFDNARLMGQWSFLFFGYTFCPDVCPMTLTMFQELYETLAKTPEGLGNTQFVFLSVDPKRDTPKRLAEYVTYFNPEFIGVTGEPDVIEGLTESIGIVYMKTRGQSKEDYLIDHSSAVLLVDPKGRLYALFAAPHEPNAIAQAFSKIRNLGT